MKRGRGKNIRYVLSLGTEGMGFTWSYGEFWALTPAERIENVVATKEAYPQVYQILDVFTAAGNEMVVSSPHDEVYFYEPFCGIRQQVLFASELDWMCDTPKDQPRRQFLNLIAKGDCAMAAEVYREKVLPIKKSATSGSECL
jgi:hypothetical protein